MSIKLIAVDIDGTLVNSKKEITPEVFSAIQDAKEAGVKVVIATGRPIAGVAKLLDDLQLRDEGDYVVDQLAGITVLDIDHCLDVLRQGTHDILYKDEGTT